MTESFCLGAEVRDTVLGTAFFTVLAILGSKDRLQRMRIVQVSTVFKNCNSGYFWRMRVLHARLKLQGPWKALYVLCAFRTFCNRWNSFLYTHTVLIVIVGPYTFESRIHKVVELPNNIEGLVGVQLCTLFLLQICLTDGSVNTTSASGIVPPVQWYYNEIHFSICTLGL